MNVDETEARRLLAEVRRTSEETRVLHAQMMDVSAERSAAVRAALDAGIPRTRIAESAGVARTMIYRIAAEGE
ncbi:MAG: hypothetical protein KH937_03500 [Actinomyces urogenitalis]|jgi:hypothetical protein|uniref:hypothetical protein n=1 Tax=Actinomyces urogenitalis TaxID=103621 RepID=UPI002805009E|nr:hypothetical protein [Actinomyces urogenitalis]MBS6071731.1 hypothetical protein [Actinomyces urogenitalis]MDU0864600.1 hypothetical protein [Actinomyces urogenitalis]MDU0875146.1 hypothetical protein [Actinomyces urogenitalis]MDU1564607.1 hypothetical protein [Actinomyces urogenitalis]MDU1640172.1 hypothetical protein [Actinomyces urogenitalis]